MKPRGSILAVAFLSLALGAGAVPHQQSGGGGQDSSKAWDRIKSSIEVHLGKPYVWGAVGLKSFDCSGFVWRVMADNGILIKRTTARKLYFTLPEPADAESWRPGNIVFFNDLRHCGIVNDGATFYHAQSSKGTNLSRFSPYWRPLIVGFRCMPVEKP